MNWFPMPILPDLSGDETVLLVHLLREANRGTTASVANTPAGEVGIEPRQCWLSQSNTFGWGRKKVRWVLGKLIEKGLLEKGQGQGRGQGVTVITITGAWVSVCHEQEKGQGRGQGVAATRSRRKPYLPEFETFWEHYPRRSGKEDAAKAFLEALNRPGVTAIGLAEQSRAFGEALGPGLAMGAPLAGTWLRAGRYDDDPDEWIRMACRTLRLPDPTRPVLGEREARNALAGYQWLQQQETRT